MFLVPLARASAHARACRDIVQNEYIRRVEKANGQLYNVETATIEAVKDPVKATKKRDGSTARGYVAQLR
jgi:hypothetical protein